MKRVLWVSLLSVAVILAGMTVVQAKEYNIKIGGGPTGGTFNTFTNAMAVYVPKVNPNIRATSVGSGGSVENVKRVHNGESDFGVCYAVDSDLGFKGKLPQDTHQYNNIRAMGYLYGAPAQLVVRVDDGYKSAMDLKGKRVALGNAGSGAAASAERFFRHIGLWDDFKPTFLGYSQAASAFQDGKIDAFWVLVGYPNRSVIEAAVQVKIALVDVDIDAEKTKFYDAFAYSPTVIPAGTYGKGMPECKTFQDGAILTTNKDQDEELVYTVMKTLWSKEGMEAMVMAKKTFKEMTIENNFRGASVPLHPGAVKFWKEKGIEIPADLMP
ncbi:MAG TPA: TAXI family TRAP transporter solute-binding subunit [Desulfobacteraceae bacterium]|nr:TAXI family TRAP transporter solute-binding subunit [Deltaproteobacteria bacterium]HDI60608.1 TAXI family TRAP transporter solute-binding subunit [Desulfobacteraceae bacterium]